MMADRAGVVMPQRVIDRARGDDGSMIPMIIMAFVVAATLISATTAAGSAFLAQRDLQSVCDGAALSGAEAIDFAATSTVSGTEPGSGDATGTAGYLPIGSVQRAVGDYVEQADRDGGVEVSAQSALADDLTVSVTCHSHPHIALGSLFGYGEGIDRSADSSARSALTR